MVIFDGWWYLDGEAERKRREEEKGFRETGKAKELVVDKLGIPWPTQHSGSCT